MGEGQKRKGEVLRQSLKGEQEEELRELQRGRVMERRHDRRLESEPQLGRQLEWALLEHGQILGSFDELIQMCFVREEPPGD